MIVAVFPNRQKSQSKNIAKGICEFLAERKVKVAIEDQDATDYGALPLSTVDPKKIDFLISLGGDGTILRLLHSHKEITAPILGVNLGSLGFMADVPTTEIYQSLQELVDGNYTIQSRVVVEGLTAKGESSFAVNDIVVHRASNSSLVDLAIHVDGDYLNTFSADGIIISTPSGSTAYSLAAGGPIISPEIDALVITPISPHTISNRPIVLMPRKEIQIQYLSPYDPVEITFDGWDKYKMSEGEMLSISRSERVFRLVCLPQHSYFSTLRTKLGWTGKLRA
jgi:NAD+ kinase